MSPNASVVPEATLKINHIIPQIKRNNMCFKMKTKTLFMSINDHYKMTKKLFNDDWQLEKTSQYFCVVRVAATRGIVSSYTSLHQRTKAKTAEAQATEADTSRDVDDGCWVRPIIELSVLGSAHHWAISDGCWVRVVQWWLYPTLSFFNENSKICKKNAAKMNIFNCKLDYNQQKYAF